MTSPTRDEVRAAVERLVAEISIVYAADDPVMHDLRTLIAAAEALRELVACKDLKAEIATMLAEQIPGWQAKEAEYQRRKPLAWSAAIDAARRERP